MSRGKEMEQGSINVAVLTVSDSRKETEDKSGALLKERIESSGINLAFVQ